MTILFIAFVLLCLWGMKAYPGNGEFSGDWLSVENTAAVKGIFVIIVFFSHFKGYVTLTSPWDIGFYEDFGRIGQRMVIPFLLYSGYGVTVSVMKKGMDYVRKFPVKRIWRVLVEFDLALLLFILMRAVLRMPYADGSSFDLRQVLLSMVGWDSLGNSNWYIFLILAVYGMTYVGFLLCRGKPVASAVLTTVFVCGFVVFFKQTGIKPAYWYNTAVCYCVGMWTAIGKETIERFVMRSELVYRIVLSAVVLAGFVSIDFASRRFLLYEVSMLLFALTVLLLSMKLELCNPALVWLGRRLFPIYILQRIPMTFCQQLFPSMDIYVMFVLCLALTLIMAWLFDKLTERIFSGRKNTKRERQTV